MENLVEIPGTSGQYSVSPEGFIYSHKTNKALKPGADKQGYLAVSFCVSGKISRGSLHRIVAQAFVPNPEGLPEVNHINGIKADCRAENLEWATRQQNAKHGWDTGLIPTPPSWKGKMGAAHNRSKAVIEYDSAGNAIREYGSASEAARALGLNITTISLAAKKGSVVRSTKTTFKFKDPHFEVN